MMRVGSKAAYGKPGPRFRRTWANREELLRALWLARTGSSLVVVAVGSTSRAPRLPLPDFKARLKQRGSPCVL